MPEQGWKIVSFYKKQYGENAGKWHIYIVYYTGNREWKDSIEFDVTEKQLIDILLSHCANEILFG